MRILLVEDEARVASFIRKGLEEALYIVDVACDGTEALDIALATEHDLIILDVRLPMRDGISVCRELRAQRNMTPILMLTARDTVDDRVRGLDAGADDYLVKPFEFGELVARVRALLRRGQPERPTVLTIGDLEVDPAARTVSRGGVVVQLTAREFAVLEFLVRHAGTVISRTELLDHVWDSNYEGSTNLVDVYVGYLRRKLEDPFGRTLIRTVRGVGYVIDSP
jgi:two-component system OmpR family response regulator